MKGSDHRFRLEEKVQAKVQVGIAGKAQSNFPTFTNLQRINGNCEEGVTPGQRRRKMAHDLTVTLDIVKHFFFYIFTFYITF